MSRRRGIGALIALAVLVIVLLVADRVSAGVAADSAQRYLAKESAFSTAPKVKIDGFPFLTQAIAGRYDQVEVESAAVTLGGVPATDLRATLHGVHLPISKALGGSVTALPVDSINGTVVFGYDEIAKLLAIPDLTIADSGGQLRVSATLTVPGLNVAAAVTGTGSAVLADGVLHLSVTQLSVAGVSVGGDVLNQLTAALAVPIPIPALPYGLRVDAVTTTSAGVVVSGVADHAVISQS